MYNITELPGGGGLSVTQRNEGQITHYNGYLFLFQVKLCQLRIYLK